MKNDMKRENDFCLKFCVMFVSFTFFIVSLGAIPLDDGWIVKGRVLDETTNEAVIGANIIVKGTGNGTITDMDGYYQIKVSDQNSILVVSFIGYTTQEIPIKNQKNINVSLKSDSQNLEEVVVIAYGTQNKGLVTSALSSIDNKELIKSPNSSVTNSLAGSIPGVSAIQSSGQPGADAAKIYVRGAGSLNNDLSSPLILVDGIERDFSEIDPNEIESISVLKDASATAVFGVRGANGVILVSTRRGSSGKPKVSASTSLGLQQPISLVEQTGSYEFARMWNIKQKLDGITDKKLYFTPEQIEAYRTGSDPLVYPNINWGDYLYRNVFLQSKNNVNISGGNDNIKYFVSVGYLYQNGLLKDMPGLSYNNNYRYDRYNYRANIDAKLTKTTTMKLGIGGNIGITQEPNVVENISNPWTVAQVWSLPFAGPGFVDGVRTVIPQGITPISERPRDGLFVFYGYGYKQKYSTTANMDLDLTQKLDFVIPGLSLSLKGAYDNLFNIHKNRQGGAVEYQNIQYKSYFDSKGTLPETDPDYDKTHVFTPVGSNTPLTYSESSGRDYNWYLEGRLNYDRSFGYHKVTALLLYNQSRNYYPTNPNGSAMTYQYIPRSYIGLVGRATYSYNSKYMVDVNMGYNGSENFAPGKTRFGLFPAFSLGWVVTGEKFMERQHLLDFLKLRLSWGRVGNDRGTNSRFMYMPSVWSDSGSYSFGVNNPVNSPASAISTIGNSEVTWETADKQNYGIDMKILSNRLSLTFDYFIEKRKGILIAPNSIPNIVAFASPNMNIGKVDNQGYEVSLGWKDNIGEDWNYYLNANVSYARNKIIFNDEVPNEYDYMNETGGPTGRYKNIYIFERLYQYSDFTQDEQGNLILDPSYPKPTADVRPGDAMYADLNGDNVIDGNDRCVYGYSDRPEYVFGINMGLNWKGLSLSMQWTGASHVDKMLQLDYRIPFTNSGGRGLLTYLYDKSWTPENQLDARYPRPAETSESWNSMDSSLWIQNASYLRLKNICLGYTFMNNKVLKKLGINSLNLNFTGYNLLTFTPLEYIDPEGNTTNIGGYPLTKIYSFGLNLNF
ncbi:SusC/RagA family TonB-linked outer membrane protein [Bacteroides caecigallinarum]|uniref:SusC/RagA family TonB-linked outer membrane protein n=1 Tax=Bacteroides caecigallinarum TaxID=1411144 RepID=UPI001EF74588|nr:TonB-dependent receptor [Bacteroides caecigallinarum]